jgi:hypothetical protein
MKVENMKREKADGWYADTSEDLLTASFTLGDLRYGISRYAHEDHWVADSLFKANGFPVFCNGKGSRCTALHIIDDVSAIALLDEAAQTV